NNTARVTNSVISGGGIFAGDGSIAVYHSKFTNGSSISGHNADMHVVGNTFIGPGTGIFNVTAGFPQDIDANTFKNGSAGISITGLASGRIAGNTIKSPGGDGIVVDSGSSAGLFVVGNTVTGGAGDGIHVLADDNGSGPFLSDVTLTANNAFD